MATHTKFEEDIKYGNIGTQIFEEDFLKFLDINYQDVTGCQSYQIIDTDFITKIGLYEIKLNYKDDKYLIIEEYANKNPKYGSEKGGWFYRSKADLIISISKRTRTMIFLPFTDSFKSYYEENKNQHQLIYNKPSIYKGRTWQSAFRKLPFSFFGKFISVYKRLNELKN